MFVSCTGDSDEVEEAWSVLEELSATPEEPPPVLDLETVEAGRVLYFTHCASCHGADLGGDPNWKTPGPDGLLPPPPMDASGHTWHHSDQVLLKLVRGERGYPSAMPEFAGTLTDTEIMSIVAFFKSTWGDEERTYQWTATWREARQTP